MPSILSSLFVGVMLALAAVELHRPEALLMLAFAGIWAFISHEPALPRAIRFLAWFLGIANSLFVIYYLIINL